MTESVALPELSAASLPAEPWSDWLRTAVGGTLDAAVVAAVSRVVDAALLPSAAALPALRAAAAPFVAGPLARAPRRYFAFVDQAPDPLEVETRYRRRRPGGVIVGRRFAGRYVPYGDAPPDPDADAILVEHWMHTDAPPRGTLLALHGFAMGQPWLDARALLADAWFARGLDVALLTLPYHGARAGRAARVSGQRFADPHPMRLHDAVRRAVYEIHAVRGWLRQASGRPVGLLGLSLGGYLSALTAGLVDDLDFVMPMVPPVCIGDLAWRFFARSRRAGDAAAYTHAELRATYRVHSPLSHRLRVPRERVLIIAGRGDRIVPPEHPHALWRHWDGPAIHWFSGSHLAPFGRAGIVAAGVAHLERLGIL
ncbi:MAG: hypothetical protein SF182_25870 [Deltaproteobacteria bacterium]|nr:hypothetical protein [Deltaproteobacteria bacterium]